MARLTQKLSCHEWPSVKPETRGPNSGPKTAAQTKHIITLPRSRCFSKMSAKRPLTTALGAEPKKPVQKREKEQETEAVAECAGHGEYHVTKICAEQHEPPTDVLAQRSEYHRPNRVSEQVQRVEPDHLCSGLAWKVSANCVHGSRWQR